MRKFVLFLTLNLFATVMFAQVNLEGNYIKTGTNGGTPPYQWKINGGIYQNTDTFKNLIPGLYTITIKDSRNCTRSTSVRLYAQLKISAVTIGETSISVAPSGGTAGYYYSINLGPYILNQTTFTGLDRGTTYLIRVKDSLGYISSLYITTL